MMWTRTDGLVLEVCEYGYCFVTQNNEAYSQHALASLGIGWSYLIIPLIIGIFIGGLLIYMLMLKLSKTKKTTTTS